MSVEEQKGLDVRPDEEMLRQKQKKESRRAQIKQILRDKLGIKEIRTIVIGRSKREMNLLIENEIKRMKEDETSVHNGKLIFADEDTTF